MSHYGPGGSYSDHPDDAHREQPWESSGSEPHGPGGYRPPADPWGQSQGSWADLTTPQPRYGDRPDPGGYDQPTHRQASGPPTAPYGQQHYQQPYHQPYAEPYPEGSPWEAPRPRRTGLVATLVVLLVLVLAGGVGLTLFLVSGGGEDDPLLTGDGATSDPSATGSPGENGEVPENRIGLNATVALVDDCMVNDAESAEPEMRIVPCDTDEDGPVYQVLARFDQQVNGDTNEELDQSAQQICAAAEGYEYFYRFIGPTEDQSFVLCMIER